MIQSARVFFKILILSASSFVVFESQAANFISNTAQLALQNPIEVYALESQTLKFKMEFPAGAVIEYDPGAQPENYDYEDRSGQRRRSSTGFSKIHLVNVPQEALPDFPLDRIREINRIPGGLFVFASKLQEEIGRDLISPLPPSVPGDDFLIKYEASGQPKFSFTAKFKERFGDQLNKVVSRNDQRRSQQRKWSQIMRELTEAVNRTQETPGTKMFVNQEQAKKFSELFEETGKIQKMGAWSIAVTGTARRHGFENVPCAEFVSEVLRQAYTRAGYKVTDDFNSKKGNPLIWNHTAAVVNLANSLAKAGWIPWEAAKYKIPVGAPVMHYLARSPGHAYLSAGEEGKLIVDNGSPRGRDLRRSPKKIIDLMFLHGVFFLPPGIVPEAW